MGKVSRMKFGKVSRMNFIDGCNEGNSALERVGPKLMKYDDLVVIYEKHDSMTHVTLRRNGIFDNKFGNFHHCDFIGQPFGSKINSRSSPGWLYALEATPELWNLALTTRTQIVSTMDSSIITLKLDLFPGCIVAESGTGSGCMTLAIARAIAPTGHVHTYEYNKSRAGLNFTRCDIQSF